MSNTIQSIDGQELPLSPVSYNPTVQDIDGESTGRSAETGVLIRHVVRQNVHKIDVSFRGKASAIKTIRNLVSKSKFTVVFWDLDEWISAEMYVSDRSMTLHPTPFIEGFYDLTFSLIEY